MSFKFTTIDEPNAAQGNGLGTEVFGISSNTGVIVGGYHGPGNSVFGFADFLGNFTTLPSPPAALAYATTAVNDTGSFVGLYVGVTGEHGYLDSNGVITKLDDPNGFNTLVYGINDSGKVVGNYSDANGTSHAFAYSGGANGTFSDLFIPGAVGGSFAVGINAAGMIAGYYFDAADKAHGFVKGNLLTFTIDVPGAEATGVSGINDSGEIVGQYTDSNGEIHGFLENAGVFTTFDDPRGGQISPFGINDAGVITGYYADASGQNHGFVASRATPRDFYGAGTASVLWRNGSGLSSWNMFGSSAGSTIFSGGAVTWQGQALDPDASWSVAGIADFNADGEADMLWRQTGGPLALWQMNGATVSASNSVTYNGGVIAPDASWNVAAVADFTADSEADILWRQGAGGALSLWSMNGSQVTSSNAVTLKGSTITPDASWSVAGAGDFNGDGFSDLLWRQSSGVLSLWDMNGSQIAASATVTDQGSAIAPDASWTVAGVGDFNGDGRADLLWRQSNGTLALWQMNNSSVTSSSAITFQGSALIPDASWKIVEVADFDGDGHSDILWRNDNGTMAEWLMNGAQVIASIAPGVQGNTVSPDASWSVQGNATTFA